MIYYIADTHFNDQRIFDLCRRPFKDLETYQNEVIKRWNNKVNKDDIVYVLGDIIKDDDKNSINIFKRLKGHKHLIVGNHDLKMLDEIIKSNIFESVKYMDLINDNNRLVYICHYPIMDWMEFNKGSYHVYGHIHNKSIKQGEAYQKIKDYYKDLKAYNCGVDVINYEPVTLDEMIELKEKNKDEAYIN